MAMNIKAPSAVISASTTTANAAYVPAGNAARFVRVTNHSATSGVYINSGSSGVTATSANIALAPYETAVFERDPADTNIAALLISGTGIVSCALVSGAD